MLVAIPFLAVVLGLMLGFFPMRAGRSDLAMGVAGLLATLLALVLWKEQTSAGLDMLVWTGLWLFVLTPGLAALTLGAGLGHLVAV